MGGHGSNLLGSLLPLVALFAIFYFLIIRPQQKQSKNHKKMLSELSKGQVIVTNGGLIVEIIKVEEDFLKVKNPDGSELKLIKTHVAKQYEKNS